MIIIPQESPGTRRHWAEQLALIACTLGAILAVFAAYETLRAQFVGFESPSGCTINQWLNCEAAQGSSHALLLGVPIAFWGLLYYLWIAISVARAQRRREAEKATHSGALLMSLLALGLSLYKAGILFFVLKTLCPVCVLLYLINLAIVVLLWRVHRAAAPAPSNFASEEQSRKKSATRDAPASSAKHLRPALLAYAVYAAIFFSGGAGIAKWSLDHYFGLAAIDVEEAVAEHFNQPKGRIEIHPFAPVWGNPNAAVRMAVYSDFQCPHCRRAASLLKSRLAEFESQVSLAFMNFPLDRKINFALPHAPHEQAGLAARAAVCAQQFGNFWAFHDSLFQNQQRLEQNFILDLAEKQGWKREEFAAALEQRDTYLRVVAEIQYAARLKIASTPAIVINGRRLELWEHSEIFRRVVEEEIRRANENS